jgi:3-deoxy-D-manno-octulosonate 8-phosphate phosphatase KdsC-like HAD superfamily phosphatase
MDPVRNVAHIVLRTPGGQGALRELTESLLEAQRSGDISDAF